MAELKRALGFWTILSLAVASIMGSGMYFSIRIGSEISGPGVILAWIILTGIGLYISTFFGELVAMFPKAGGIYEFSKHAYSRFFSFIIGWTAWLVGNITVALLVVASVDYLLPNPDAFLLKIIISITFIVLLNVIAYFGIEASAFILVIFALITVSLVLSIIIPGAFQLDSSFYTPFLPFGVPAVLVTIFFIAEGFFGWESSTYLAEEVKNPEKIIPRALMLGTIVVGVLGIGLSIVSLGLVPWQDLAVAAAPLSTVANVLFGEAFMKALNIGVFVTLMGSAAGGIITMPRLILALARDKLFITQFADVHPKYQTPHKAIFFQTIVAIIIFAMAFGKYQQLLSLTLPIGFIMYALTLFIVFKLRFTHPEIKRPFKVPFAKIGAPLLILGMASLLVTWVLTETGAITVLGLAVSFILLGVPIYLLLEMYYDPDNIIRINDKLAFLTLLLENIILPKRVRKNITSLLGDVRGKSLLEFGCSVGTFTTFLARMVKPDGRIFATDLSEREVMIARKRLVKEGHNHVVVIHDEHQVNRVHPHIPHVDAIVSIGMMGYLQDVKKVLREMRDLLPYGGKIVFMDYADFFKFIPNVQWLSSDKEIERMFREAGFSVYVRREKGLFWNYVYVYGIKFHEDIPYA